MPDIYIDFNDIIKDWCERCGISALDEKTFCEYLNTEQGRKKFEEAVQKRIDEVIIKELRGD